MSKAKMLGYNKPYTPNNRATTPGRKKTAAVKQIGNHPDTRDLVKRYFEKKEK